MNEAIKLAIEQGGYKEFPKIKGSTMEYYPNTASWWCCWEVENEEGETIQLESPCCYDSPDGQRKLVLDPLFWQSLGKALGWRNMYRKEYPRMQVRLEHDGQVTSDSTHIQAMDEWLYHAHQYFELLLTNGDTEQFWKDLLTK